MSKLPKVLVIGINAWQDNTGINTLTNLFKNWDNNNLYQIYTRSELPSTKVCNNFFQISEISVLKSIFNRKIKTGKVVENNFSNSQHLSKSTIEERTVYSFIRKHRSFLFYILREIAWKLGKWDSKELDDFIDKCDADVIFMPIYSYSYMASLQEYVIKRVNKPVITYITDDVYSYKSTKANLFFYLHRFLLRRNIRKVMKYNNQLFVIAPKVKKEFDEIFKTNSKILTKGIDFNNYSFKEKQINEPIKFVYTGKLNLDRWKSLSILAQEIKKINRESIKAMLYIYTMDDLSKKVANSLNLENASKIMGPATLDEVLKIQQDADILVFTESLSWRFKDIARLSFSTKLTDYMANGKCILAIGKEDIAPIEYLKENDAALIASNHKEITSQLKKVCHDKSIINIYALNAYRCGVKNHSEEDIQKLFKNTLINVSKMEVDT